MTVGSSGRRPKGTGASEGYPVGCSGGHEGNKSLQ